MSLIRSVADADPLWARALDASGTWVAVIVAIAGLPFSHPLRWRWGVVIVVTRMRGGAGTTYADAASFAVGVVHTGKGRSRGEAKDSGYD